MVRGQRVGLFRPPAETLDHLFARPFQAYESNSRFPGNRVLQVGQIVRRRITGEVDVSVAVPEAGARASARQVPQSDVLAFDRVIENGRQIQHAIPAIVGRVVLEDEIVDEEQAFGIECRNQR